MLCKACEANRSLYLEIMGSEDIMSHDDTVRIVVRLRPSDGALLARWTVPYHASMAVVPANGRVVIPDDVLRRLIVYSSDGDPVRYVDVDCADHWFTRSLLAAGHGRTGLIDDSALITVQVSSCSRLQRTIRKKHYTKNVACAIL